MMLVLMICILITDFLELCVLSAIYEQGEKKNATESN